MVSPSASSPIRYLVFGRAFRATRSGVFLTQATIFFLESRARPPESESAEPKSGERHSGTYVCGPGNELALCWPTLFSLSRPATYVRCEDRRAVWLTGKGVKVGNEFSSVEALWSQFESVMAKDVDADADKDSDHGRDDGDVQANDPQDDSEAKNMPEEGATTVTTPKRGD